MKKYFIALSAFTIFAISANAQEKRNTTGDAPMAHHDKMKHGKHDKGMMMKQLNLTDAQKQKAKSIREDYKNQMKQLNDNSSMSAGDLTAKKEALKKEQKSKFESLLTTDQKNKMQQLRKEQTADKGKMDKQRMVKMKSSLNLSDDQISKLQSEHNNFKTQAKTIQDNTSLSQEQKKQQIMELKKKSKEDEKNILTAEQLQKKEQLRSSRMSNMKNKKSEKS